MAIDKKITIYTKEGSPKFGARALVLDLSRGVTPTYNTAVAKHPIEGAASAVSDHSYLSNIKITISGHVSDAVGITPQTETESYQPYAEAREDNAYITTMQETIDNNLIQVDAIESVSVGTPLTSEQAEAMNAHTVFPEGLDPYTEGQVVSDVEKGIASYNVNESLDSLVAKRTATETIEADRKEVLEEKNLRIIYPTDSSRKQLDAFELLEGIYYGRLLVDLLTSHRLYENMVMSNLSLPRAMGAGQALEIRATFEQQSFVSAFESETTTVPTSASDNDIVTQKNNGKNQGKDFQLDDASRNLLNKFTKLVDTLGE